MATQLPFSVNNKFEVRADQGVVLSGGFVASVTDANGGAGIASVATGSLAIVTTPINGKPSFNFTGSQRLTSGGFLGTAYNSSFTFFCVNRQATPSLKIYASNQTTNFYVGRNSAASIINVNCNGLTTAANTIITNNDIAIDTFRYNGATLDVFCNERKSSVASTGSVGFDALGTLTIGGLSGGGFEFLGAIYHVVMFNRALSDAECAQVRSVLGSIWLSTVTTCVIDGDSIPAGYGLADPNQNLGYLAATALGITTNNASLHNYSSAGDKVEDATARQATSIALSALPYGGINLLTFMEDTNSVGNNESAATIQTAMIAYGTGAKALGYTSLLNVGMLPRNSGTNVAAFEAVRQGIRTLRLADHSVATPYPIVTTNPIQSAYSNTYVDTGLQVLIGAPGAATNTTLFSVDAIHPILAGHYVMALPVALGMIVSGISPVSGAFTAADRLKLSALSTNVNVTSWGGTTVTALPNSGTVVAGTVLDKTGYTTTQTYPSNFGTMLISGGGFVNTGTNPVNTGSNVVTVSTNVLGGLPNDGTGIWNLRQFNIINNSGHAFVCTSGAGGANGMILTGGFSSAGLRIIGGTSGDAVQIQGGSGIGNAVTMTGGVSGYGLGLSGGLSDIGLLTGKQSGWPTDASIATNSATVNTTVTGGFTAARTNTANLSSSNQASLTAAGLGGGGSFSGVGPIPVNQNTGGTNNMTVIINGIGQSGILVSAYLQTDYTAGSIDRAHMKGQAITDANGNWSQPMALAAGTYAFTFGDRDDIYPVKQNVTVA